jgi:hypothetical protein
MAVTQRDKISKLLDYHWKLDSSDENTHMTLVQTTAKKVGRFSIHPANLKDPSVLPPLLLGGWNNNRAQYSTPPKQTEGPEGFQREKRIFQFLSILLASTNGAKDVTAVA